MTSKEECVAIMEAQHFFISASQNKTGFRYGQKNRSSLSCIGGITGGLGSVEWSWWFLCRVMLVFLVYSDVSVFGLE